MAAFLYFRRRRGAQAGNVAGGMGNHAGWGGRKGPEKKRKKGAASDASGHSDEPLCPIQPVFDGYPGSTGYDDVRSLHSTVHSHSPTGAQSPTHSQSGGFWTHERSIEREELTAARLRSQLQASAPTVVSYGPNPVTPTLMPRTQPRLNVNSAATPMSPGSTDQMPYVSHYTDYSSYSLPPPSAMSDPNPSPPRKPAVPAVVSYGPNKVTPTPQVVSPTVPPDESIVKRRFAEAAAAQSAASNERKFSWEADSPLLGVSMGPLPPYASSEEFEAMEKGAVRKLAEPQAEAELPPTKDGFYHYTSDTVEYELPGAAPQHEPQLPFRPYLQHAHAQAGPSSSGGGGGGRTNRVIDEQKFLLSDAEISRMRAEKAARGDTAAAPAVRAMEEEEGESYDLGDARSRR
ncbi:1f63a052-6d10-4683-8f1f-1aaab1b27c66 [Thermothielavioides terrestris]|uniref:1f63a052-6d10-4683-8f1f-1aaab1b27c66 n=1 Tax=Thermothielavioides terrestris TaxID=2587410 RepID=A0A3S4EYU1_9PEZI|nr:1f63a052-6d10-4683-8f1f-1aaab1b27c66 [Thermothielavioides terrestris]